MSNTDYKIYPEMIEAINYELLIIGFPQNDLEDFLTQFVSEKGKISRSYYEDVLIAHFVANLNQFMAYLNSPAVVKEVDLLKVREELTKDIIQHNPNLAPQNIIINKNNVLKIRTNENDEGTQLDENSHWSKTYYDSEGNYTPIDNTNKPSNNYMEKPNRTYNATDSSEGLKSLDELRWTKSKVWWDRIGEYIFIKHFELEDVEHLIRQRYFHNNMSFNTFIVQECVLDVEELYDLIDGLGVKVSPAPIIKELFSLCKGVNEGIDFDIVLSYQKDEETDEEDAKPSRKGGVKSYTKGYESGKKKKQELSFKTVKKEDLLQLNADMKLSLIGQDKAVDNISESVKRASVGLKDPKKPIGSFLFAGRTGVGKTLTSKVLADALIKTRQNRIIIDCSEYSSDHEYAKLIGAPAGYIGHDSGGVLTNAITENPFSVVVFDEIEKASSKVHELMLQILDEGRLTDGKGTTVSFKDTIILMTSNIGVKEVDEVTKTIGFGDVAILTEAKKNSALDTALKSKFKPEFLNRIDSIVHFKDLNKKDYMQIIDLELAKLSDNLHTNNTDYKDIELIFDVKVRNFIYKEGVDEKFGARPITRAIERCISAGIATELLSNDYSPMSTINVSALKGKVKLTVIEPEEPKEKSLLLHGGK